MTKMNTSGDQQTTLLSNTYVTGLRRALLQLIGNIDSFINYLTENGLVSGADSSALMMVRVPSTDGKLLAAGSKRFRRYIDRNLGRCARAK